MPKKKGKGGGKKGGGASAVTQETQPPSQTQQEPPEQGATAAPPKPTPATRPVAAQPRFEGATAAPPAPQPVVVAAPKPQPVVVPAAAAAAQPSPEPTMSAPPGFEVVAGRGRGKKDTRGRGRGQLKQETPGPQLGLGRGQGDVGVAAPKPQPVVVPVAAAAAQPSPEHTMSALPGFEVGAGRGRGEQDRRGRGRGQLKEEAPGPQLGLGRGQGVAAPSPVQQLGLTVRRGDVSVIPPPQLTSPPPGFKGPGAVAPARPRPEIMSTQPATGLTFGETPLPQKIGPPMQQTMAGMVQQPAGGRPKQSQQLGPQIVQPPTQRPKEKSKTPPAAAGAAAGAVAAPKKEMSMVSVAKALPSAPSNGGMKPPVRKDFGRIGMPIKLRVNHFEVKFDSKAKIYHYDIDIKPEIKAMKGLKRKIVECMVVSYPKIFGHVKCVFDGEKNMYSSGDLRLGRDELELEVTLPRENPQDRERKQTIAVKQVAEIYLSELQHFLDGETRTVPQHTIQALDIVLRHMPTLRFITIGRSIFPITDRGQDLGGGVELWRGCYQSLRPGWKQLQLNLDVSNRTFYKAQTVLDFACEFMQCNNHNDLRQCRPYQWAAFGKEMKGLHVRATHTSIPRKYKIIGLSPKPAELQKFPLTLEDGGTVECTVAKFFTEKHNKRLMHPQLYCLQAQPMEKHRYLPLEVCIIPVGQQCKKLSDMQTATMIRSTAVPAPQRQRDVQDLLKNANLNQDPYVRGFGLSVSDTLMTIDGRILPPPSLNLRSFKVLPREGVWDMRSRQFFTGASISQWGVLTMARVRPEEVANFCRELRKIAGDTGMNISEPSFSEIVDQRENQEKLFMRIKERYSKLELILVVLPGKTPLYAEIKRLGDTRYGIVTQCVQQKNVSKANPATVTNILMKINAKLGGINSILEPLSRSPVFKTPVMFLGADVTHPPAGDRTKPSIAAIVGSMDKNAQVYVAKVCVQEHRMEIIKDLQAKTRELLLGFYNKLGVQPAKIIFYRDGVGEGQFNEVLRHELVAMRAACSSLSQTYKPSITFLVVQKRHHTRLFCDDTRKDSIGRSNNVPPGTTVDTAIIHPIENDFFLCSHQGIQGTSRPTHYHVLWDDNDFTADELQSLTYQLCHTYVRCTRSVSIPAPAYYAHLVAFRARYHLEQLQGRVDRESGDPTIWLKKMQEAVQIHETTGTMYYV